MSDAPLGAVAEDDPRRRLAEALRPIISLNVSATFDDEVLTAAATALEEIGLIGRVVPDGTALETALEIAEVIGANGPLAVEAIKASVKATEGIPEVEALKIELELGWPIFATEDAAEGQKAFAEKRPPVYKRK